MLLFLFTGSVLLPIKAVLTNLLSIGAALGAVVWVFQQGHLAALVRHLRLAPHLTVPVLVAAIAFGLSVDYEVFLLSRIRERWLAGGARGRGGRRGPAAHRADHHLGRAAAGGRVRRASSSAGSCRSRPIGLGLVLAVALDATIVRMLLVPATMTLLGRYNWWAPAPLRRLHARFAGGFDETTAAAPPRDRELVAAAR